MNKGLEILMARIESHPEEFESNGIVATRWDYLIREYEKVLPEEDMKAFRAKLYEKRCERFTELVMQELLDPKSETEAQVSAMPSGGMTHVQYLARQQASLQAQNLALNQQISSLNSQGLQQQSSNSQGFLSSLFGGVK